MHTPSTSTSPNLQSTSSLPAPLPPTHIHTKQGPAIASPPPKNQYPGLDTITCLSDGPVRYERYCVRQGKLIRQTYYSSGTCYFPHVQYVYSTSHTILLEACVRASECEAGPPPTQQCEARMQLRSVDARQRKDVKYNIIHVGTQVLYLTYSTNILLFVSSMRILRHTAPRRHTYIHTWMNLTVQAQKTSLYTHTHYHHHSTTPPRPGSVSKSPLQDLLYYILTSPHHTLNSHTFTSPETPTTYRKVHLSPAQPSPAQPSQSPLRLEQNKSSCNTRREKKTRQVGWLGSARQPR